MEFFIEEITGYKAHWKSSLRLARGSFIMPGRVYSGFCLFVCSHPAWSVWMSFIIRFRSAWATVITFMIMVAAMIGLCHCQYFFTHGNQLQGLMTLTCHGQLWLLSSSMIIT